MKKRIGTLVVLASCFLIFAAASEAARPFYDIQLHVDIEEKELTAIEQVTWTNPGQEPVSEVVFHIYPNRKYSAKEKEFMYRFGGFFKVNHYPEGFEGSLMSIMAVEAQGRALDYKIDGKDQTLLKVQLPQALAPGHSLTLTIDFVVDIPHAYGRFGWHENVIRLSRWYPLLAVYEDGKWDETPFYPFHRPFYSEAADYKVELTIAENQVVISSGKQIKESLVSSGDDRSVRFESEKPIREFTLAMSPDYRSVSGTFQGVTIWSYYLPGYEAQARMALDNAVDLFEYYTKIFGPYPYSSFSIAPVHLAYGGEQKSNMIYIDTRVYQLPGLLKRYFDFLIAHETGHQWFYNVVGVNEYTQMWLEEGLNSYFMSEYLEAKYGPDAEIPDYPNWFADYEWLLPKLTFKRTRDYRYKMATRIGWDNAVIDKLSSFREPSKIFSITYGKGSRIFAMLRTVIGDEAFFRVFRRVYSEFQFKNLDIDDFIRISQQESGQDLTSFYDQWIFNKGYLDYAVKGVDGQEAVLINEGDVVMPMDVHLDYQDGSSDVQRWDGQGQEYRVALKADAKLKQVSIDPAAHYLDIDRLNNFYPRKLHIRPVPIYLGLYDMPLFQPEDSYNVTFGPELAGSGIGVKASVQRPYEQILYAGTDYEFGESLHHSRVGYALSNIFRKHMSLGAELSNTNDVDDGDDDLASVKLFLRRELFPAQYGLSDINDHWTAYIIRNQRYNDSGDFGSSREDDRNLDYARNESIVGASLHLNRSGPYPDPANGWRANLMAESAGHFLGSKEYFHRGALDLSIYQPVTESSKFAVRLKGGWGHPDDKTLFFLGGFDGLRGYKRKAVRGAQGLLGSIEYRFPLLNQINFSLFDNILRVNQIDGVVFADAGQAWYQKFADAELKKNAGCGLRMHVNVGSFLEKVVVRLDVASAINDGDEDTRFWFGLNHLF